jgi:hypothetical protein
LKDAGITNWSIKSFNASFGFKGTYPLYKLREEKEGADANKRNQTNEIITLTDHLKNGMFTWDAPEGEWTVIRYGWTCTGAVTSTTSDGWSGYQWII